MVRVEKDKTVGWPPVNPALAFIETDELEQFVADGGTREVRYCQVKTNGSGPVRSGFQFAYKQGERWAMFNLDDEVHDPSVREGLILAMEKSCLKSIREASGAGSVS